MWPRWFSLILTFSLVTGCAAPSLRTPPEHLVSHLEGQAKKQKFQEELLAQMGRATLTDYRDYVVGPEDLLEIDFFGQDELYREIRVNGRGEVSLPLVGPVTVAGLTPGDIEEKLVRLYKEGDFINNPQITVFVKEYRHQRVMVTGGVASPGSYEVIGPRTLLEILGKAGGLNEKAGDVVHIIRAQSASDLTKVLKGGPGLQSFSPGSETIVVDLRRLLLQGDMKLNIPIKSGDVVHVPYARSAYVLGAVRKPGQIPVKENITVAQAVALSHGVDPMLASSQISVLRFDEAGQRITIPVNLDRVTAGLEEDPPLKENDIVFVKESGFRRFMFNFKNLLPGSFGASVPLIP
jgi:polysaccharide export outer membrane protein